MRNITNSFSIGTLKTVIIIQVLQKNIPYIVERVYINVRTLADKGGVGSLHSFPAVYTAAVIYRQTVFEDMGGFDENLFDFEDVDLSWRMFYRGYSFVFCTSLNAVTRLNPPTLRIT